MTRQNTEPGWISQETLTSLPARFQEAARELQRRGELTIEGEEIVRSTRMNEGSHGTPVFG